MNLVTTVLEIVAPVFLLAAIGFGWVRAGFEYRMAFVTRLAMTLALPALIFTSLMQAEIDAATLGAYALAVAAGLGALTVAVWGWTTLAGLERRTYVAPLIFGNSGNLGLPLALFAFGPEGLSYAIIMFAGTMVWNFTFGLWVLSGGGAPWRVAREPMLWATLLGALFLWQGWTTPLFLTNALELIGQMAIPIMLITLGVAVARITPRRIGHAVWLCLLRTLLCVALGWGIGTAFGLAPVPFAVFVLQLATPVAVMTYMLAEKYEADTDAVAGLVMVSTVMSVLYLPALLAVLL